MNNYIDEAEVFIYLCILSTIRDVGEGIAQDAFLFFNSNFRNYVNRPKLNTLFMTNFSKGKDLIQDNSELKYYPEYRVHFC